MMIYPWQTDPWQQLVSRQQQDRLPHAILLTGSAGLGKRDFAEHFASSVLCHDTDHEGMACGQCRSCLLLKAGSHPDIIRIEPEEAGKAIKVDQIRALGEFTVLSAQFSQGYKVVLIDPAENMNKAAANSLLKTLEEPAANTLLILVSSAPQQLLPTILSRCQRVSITAPGYVEALQWLQKQSVSNAEQWLEIADGSPVTALQLAQSEDAAVERQYEEGLDILEALLQRQQDPVSIAAQWQKNEALHRVKWLTFWVMDIIRLGQGGTSVQLACPSQRGKLVALANTLDIAALHTYLAHLYDALRLLTSSQPNQQLLLEEILIRWTALPRNRL